MRLSDFDPRKTIGKPVSTPTRVVLGILSFLVLIGAYTLISNRAYRINPNQKAVPGWIRGDRSLLQGLKKILLNSYVPYLGVETSLENKQVRIKGVDSGSPGEQVGLGKQENLGAVIAEVNGKAISYPSELRTIVSQLQPGDTVNLLVRQGDRTETVSATLSKQVDEVGWLYQDAAISMKRFGLGVLVGTLLAFVVGIGMGCYAWLEAFLKPPISFLASIPPTAMMVVYMLLFSLDLKMFVAVVGMGIFPTLAISIFQAVKNDVPETAINKAYTLGASPFEVIFEVIIPQILPRIIDAVRLQIGPAMIFLIAVELGLGSEGIGYRLRNSTKGNYFNVIFIYLILLGVFGMAVNLVLTGLRRWMCPWFGEAK